jgi:hypothetical protein
MILQAFFDDSGNEPNSPVFVLAGLISTYERLAKFSDDWQSVLDESPRLDYFKMAEAEHFNKQFRKARGWDSRKRDKRLSKLTGLISQYVIGGVYAHLAHERFNLWIKSIRVPKRFSGQDHPYFVLFYTALRLVAELRKNAFRDAQCDVIFDTQGSLGADAIYHWNRIREIPGYSYDPPIFRDEKEFLPLRAADLYAWHLRRKLSNQDGDVARPTLLQLEGMATLGMKLSDEDLQGLSHRLISLREAILESRPSTRLYGPGQGPRRKPLGKTPRQKG